MNSAWLNPQTILILIDFILASILCFTAVLSFGKTRKTEVLFLVMTSLFIYFNMASRILEELNLFSFNSLLILGLPLIQSVKEYLPMLSLTGALLVILRRK